MARGRFNLYLVKRGPKYGACFHYSIKRHPIVICTAEHTMKWEAGWTGDGAWVWTRVNDQHAGGWLLLRWNGLEIDYGHVVRGCELPDGTGAGIFHDRSSPPWSLLHNATWWSDKPIPAWLASQFNVKLPSDLFSLQRILEDSGTCMLPEHKQRIMEEKQDHRYANLAAALEKAGA